MVPIAPAPSSLQKANRLSKRSIATSEYAAVKANRNNRVTPTSSKVHSVASTSTASALVDRSPMLQRLRSSRISRKGRNAATSGTAVLTAGIRSTIIITSITKSATFQASLKYAYFVLHRPSAPASWCDGSEAKAQPLGMHGRNPSRLGIDRGSSVGRVACPKAGTPLSQGH
jgi:hypothetical protein